MNFSPKIRTNLLFSVILLTSYIQNNAFSQENVIDKAATRISEAAKESLRLSVEKSVDNIVNSITGSDKKLKVAPLIEDPTVPIEKIADTVPTEPTVPELTKLPDKKGFYVGVVRSNIPGGWVVFKTGATGFEFVPPVLIDGSNETGYKICLVQEQKGIYGVLFLEKGLLQPKVINLILGDDILPGPPPGPPPGPNPNPPIPPAPSKFGLKEYIKSLLTQLPVQDKNRQVFVVMPDGNKLAVSIVEAVRNVYYDVSEQISNGDIRSITEIGPILSKQTRAVLEQAPGPGSWPNTVIIPLGERANQLYQTGKINNLQDWADALMEIYEGF